MACVSPCTEVDADDNDDCEHIYLQTSTQNWLLNALLCVCVYIYAHIKYRFYAWFCVLVNRCFSNRMRARARCCCCRATYTTSGVSVALRRAQQKHTTVPFSSWKYNIFRKIDLISNYFSEIIRNGWRNTRRSCRETQHVYGIHVGASVRVCFAVYAISLRIHLRMRKIAVACQ